MSTDPSKANDKAKDAPRGLKPLLELVGEVQRPKFAPIRERDESLLKPITRGAKAASPVLTLPELRIRIQENPEATVVFSDLHGYVELLEHVMEELGVRRCDPRRPKRVGSIGDLVDGRTESDAKALAYATRELDFITAGNHEVALMGGPMFVGQPHRDRNFLGPSLYSLALSGVLVAAEAAHGVLLTHSGVNTAYSKANAEETAKSLNSDWDTFLNTPIARSRMLREPKALLASSPSRSGGSGPSRKSEPPPGCFWQDWTELLSSYPKDFPQIVGHSARGRIESSLDDLLFNIDAAGYRLGIAVITKKGEIILGSDFISN